MIYVRPKSYLPFNKVQHERNIFLWGFNKHIRKCNSFVELPKTTHGNAHRHSGQCPDICTDRIICYSIIWTFDLD